MKKLGNNRAISPVIATVILVAVAITVAVAVAYWMGNIAGTYTASEKIEMPSSYAIYTDDLDWDGDPATLDTVEGWKIFIGLKNSGSRDATLTNIFLNEIPLKDYLSVGVVGEAVGTAGGIGTTMNLDYDHVVPDSETIYADSVALERVTDYTIDNDLGQITWVTPQTDKTITADYDYKLGALGDHGCIELFVDDDSGAALVLSAISVPVPKGGEVELILWLYSGTEGCSSGTTIDLKINSAAGNKYPVMVKLP